MTENEPCVIISNMTKKTITPEVREYFREIGRKRGNALKEKYGSDYFKQIAAKRKSFGRKPAEGSSSAYASKYGVSRQRIAQILSTHGQKFDKNAYETEVAWKEAVLADFFKTAEK